MGIALRDIKNILYNIGSYESLAYLKFIDNGNFTDSSKIGKIKFIADPDTKRFIVKVGSNQYTNIFDLYKNEESLDTYDFISDYEFHYFYGTTDFEDLINYIALDESYITMYDLDTNSYSQVKINYSDIDKTRDVLNQLINDKVPFYVHPTNGDVMDNYKSLYIGNMRDGYKIYNPLTMISNEDYEKLKVYKLMKAV